MAKFVPDIKTNRWVVIAPARVNRPHDNVPTPDIVGSCVFCPGNEVQNPLELFRVGGEAGDNSWKIRVIANKFPITDYHEVIIHSPSHDKDIDTLPLEQVELILTTYRQRYNYHQDNSHGTVMIFNNHDIHAGASIKHPHSQLVVVPKQINLDTVPREPTNNLVTETTFFQVYCPDFSQWPYEIWLAPRRLGEVGLAPRNAGIAPQTATLGKAYGDISDPEIKDLAILLQKILIFIHKKFLETGAMHQPVDKEDQTGDVPYNFYIYHGPDWYLRIIPRLVHRAGFELGTGLSVNIVDPGRAAEEYREGLR